MKMVKVVLYVLHTDDTWSRTAPMIPATTPPDKVFEVASKQIDDLIDLAPYMTGIHKLFLCHVDLNELEEDPEELVYACPECKSTQVKEQDWVMVNTHEVVDDTGRYRWCDTCESELSNNSGLLQIPRKETREWKEKHAQVHGSGD